MMKNIKKIAVAAGVLVLVILMSVGSVSNTSEAKKKKDNHLLSKMGWELTEKESKKYVKAGKIKFKYDTENNKFILTSFKKNKYAPVSKKTFSKKLDAYSDEGIYVIDGKKYEEYNGSLDSFTLWNLLQQNDRGFSSFKGIQKAFTPGKHKVKLRFSFPGDSLNRYGRGFVWSGTINIAEACNLCQYAGIEVSYTGSDVGSFSMASGDVYPLFCSIENIITNVDCKLDVNIKYIFDKKHLNKKFPILNTGRVNGKLFYPNAEVFLKGINARVGSNITFSKSFNVKKWDVNRAYRKPYCVNIYKNNQYEDFIKKVGKLDMGNYWTGDVSKNGYEFLENFNPEITYTITSKKTGKVLKYNGSVVKTKI